MSNEHEPPPPGVIQWGGRWGLKGCSREAQQHGSELFRFSNNGIDSSVRVLSQMFLTSRHFFSDFLIMLELLYSVVFIWNYCNEVD